MSSELPERDWEVFRELRDLARERFCGIVLDEIDRIRLSSSRSDHERYVEILRLLQDRERSLARAFDDPRRSKAVLQLVAIQKMRLLRPDDLARLTPETRLRVERAAALA
jgi:hypothetical protein